MSNKKSGKRTMLMSVLMSAPGPLIMAFGLLVGSSSTQIADFVRRSAELLAIIISFVIYCITCDDSEPDRKKRLERLSNIAVGAAMCFGGAIMLVLALSSDSSDKGNVIPALAIALLGVVANCLFSIKYTKLDRKEPNPILAVQARLYRAKTLVDGCVSLALLAVLLMPGTVLSYYLDMIGSAVVAVYLVFCGIKTLKDSKI